MHTASSSLRALPQRGRPGRRPASAWPLPSLAPRACVGPLAWTRSCPLRERRRLCSLASQVSIWLISYGSKKKAVSLLCRQQGMRHRPLDCSYGTEDAFSEGHSQVRATPGRFSREPCVEGLRDGACGLFTGLSHRGLVHPSKADRKGF